MGLRGELRRGVKLVGPSAREEALKVSGRCGGGFWGAVVRQLWRGKRLAAREVLPPEGTATVLEGTARAVLEGYPAAVVNGGAAFRRLAEVVESCWLGGRWHLFDARGVGTDKPEGGGKVRGLPTVGVGPAA